MKFKGEMLKILSTDQAPQAIGPYSQAVIANGFLFASGQIALTAQGEFLCGNISVQTTQVMTNIKAILSAANLSFNDVVKTTIFLTDMTHFNAVNEIYSANFGAHKPARSTVAVKELPKNALVEIEIVAFCK